MAFCPNCGTPNTDQAEKCVSCGFELAPKQKAKFKGTIMMSGIKVPGQPDPAEPGGAADAAPPAASPPTTTAPQASAPSAPSQPPERNVAFQKTMMGHAGMVPPKAPPAAPAPGGSSDFAHAATIQGPGPQSMQGGAKPAAQDARTNMGSGGGTPSSATPSVTETGFNVRGQGSASPTGGFGDGRGRTSTGSAIDSSFPGATANKPNPGKALAIGCAALLVLFCVVTGVVWAAFGAKIKGLLGGSDTGAEAAAWQASISQSLAQVSALCQNDCRQAGVFFHANGQASLLEQGMALTEPRIQKLSDPATSEAEMLDGTEDEEIAKGLGLDPQQCARVTAGAAKVVSCSVPEPGGKPSVLRIVHLSGIQSL